MKLILTSLTVLSVLFAGCTKTSEPEIPGLNGVTQKESQIGDHAPKKIMYLRMKANFSRVREKGFTLVEIDIKTGKKKEYNNEHYKNVEIISAPDPHPTEGKVITHYRKYSGAPRTIVEIELESGVVHELPNIAPQSLMPKYSPDGTKIAYHDPIDENNNARVVIYDLLLEKGEFLPCEGEKCSQVDWHPSGKKIVFIENSSKLIEYDLIENKQNIRYILKDNEKNIKVADPKYSPDGKIILFRKYKKKKIYASKLKKQEVIEVILLNSRNNASVIYKNKGIAGIEWCQDNKYIVYTSFNYSDRENLSEVHLLKIGEKKPKVLLPFDKMHMKAAFSCR